MPTSLRTRFRSAARSCATTSTALLDGEGAECTLNGLYLADGDRLVDNHTTHRSRQGRTAPATRSTRAFSAARRARCSTARSSCARTRRRPTRSRPTARCCCRTTRSINTKPQLEIFADDVKCTHGAAIGQLDEDAIFYLRARGLTYFEARDMLIHAFAGDILDRVEDRAAAGRARGGAVRAAGEGPRGD